MLPRGETTKGFARPPLGFLHQWGTKAIFTFLMNLLPWIHYNILMNLPPPWFIYSPFLFAASIATKHQHLSPASSSTCVTFPSLSCDKAGSKAWRKDPAGAFDTFRDVPVPVSREGVYRSRVGLGRAARDTRSCSGQEVLRHKACAVICIWDLSRSYQDDAKASLHPSCLLAFLSFSLFFFFFFWSRHN